MTIPAVTTCAGCEQPLLQGQNVVFESRATFDCGRLNHMTLDIFHEECWLRLHPPQDLNIPGVRFDG